MEQRMASDQVLKQIRAVKRGEQQALDCRTLRQGIQAPCPATTVEKMGYLLKDLKPEQIIGRDGGACRTVRIGILGNFNCDAVDSILRALLGAEQIRPEIYLAGYNQFVAELIDSDSGLYRFRPDVTLCLLDEHYILDAAADWWEAKSLAPVLAERAALLETLMARFKSQGHGVLVLNTPPLSLDAHETVISYRGKAELSKAWRDFQSRLLGGALQHDEVVVLDADLLMQRCRDEFRDCRLMHHAGMNLSPEFLLLLAREAVKVVQATLGRAKKCLALDLDNTLWGGVLAEDGINGIQLGSDVSGKPYLAFQHTLKALQEQGVLLAISSKNHAEVADEMFRHPGMVLKPEDFVKTAINWEPKSQNMREMAAALNIGLDAFVFVDDQAFERDLVGEQLPDVAVIDVPADAAYYSRALLEPGWFNTLALTREDRERTSTYRQRAAREELLKTAGSYEDYLRGLGIQLTMVGPSEFNLPRLTQLNLRTNQFNMTTRRFQAAEMEAIARSANFQIFGVEASDRLGGYGLVGSVIVEKRAAHNAASWHIRNYLLSCRVLARGIEEATLRYVLGAARRAGAREVYADYIASAKNRKYQDFYAANGFAAHATRGEVALFRHDLENIAGEVPWITVAERCAEQGEKEQGCARI